MSTTILTHANAYVNPSSQLRRADLSTTRIRHNYSRLENPVIDNYLAKIGGAAFAVYAVLNRIAGQRDTCFPGMEYLQTLTGFSRNTISKALAVLESHGLIGTQARQSAKGGDLSKLYTLLPLPEQDGVQTLTPPPAKSDTNRVQILTPKNTESKNTESSTQQQPAPLPLPDPAAQTAPDVVVVSSVLELFGNTEQLPIIQQVIEQMQAAKDNSTVAKPYRTCVQTPVEQPQCRKQAISDNTPSPMRQSDNSTTQASTQVSTQAAPDSPPTPAQQALDALQAAGVKAYRARQLAQQYGARCLDVIAAARRNRSVRDLPAWISDALTENYNLAPSAASSASQGASVPSVRREIVPTGFRTVVEVQPPTATGLEALRAARVKVRQANRA